jgi:Glycosyltransferase family 9 (heptosyltransferase)
MASELWQMKTIVYHSGALGDFISIIPVLRIWKMHTASPIDMISRTAHYTLTKHYKITDDGIDIDSAVIARLFTGPSTEMNTFVNTYSHAILFASESSQLVKKFKSCFKGVLYYHDPLPGVDRHCTEYQLSIIDPIQSIYAPEFRIPCIPFTSDNSLKTNRICIHTGSGSRLKNWDFSNYLKLSELLKCQGYTICWIRGFTEMSQMYPEDDYSYTVDSLIDLSIFLRDSLLFIGNDSGISHLAAACGCRVVSIFGPSDPTVWAPAGCKEISIVYNKKSCSPCHLRGSMKNNDCQRECLNSISVDSVADHCMQLISNS